MCFKFNPPNPHCINPHPCRLCPCAPKYWKLIIPAFNEYIESEAVLEWTPSPHGTTQTYCQWDQRADIGPDADGDGFGEQRAWPAGSYFATTFDWALSTRGSFDWLGQLPGSVLFEHWTVSADDGRAAWTRWPPVPANQSGLPLGSTYYHWNCLRRNRLYYAGRVGDPNGEGNAVAAGWPAYVEVEPYWP